MGTTSLPAILSMAISMILIATWPVTHGFEDYEDRYTIKELEAYLDATLDLKLRKLQRNLLSKLIKQMESLIEAKVEDLVMDGTMKQFLDNSLLDQTNRTQRDLNVLKVKVMDNNRRLRTLDSRQTVLEEYVRKLDLRNLSGEVERKNQEVQTSDLQNSVSKEGIPSDSAKDSGSAIVSERINRDLKTIKLGLKKANRKLYFTRVSLGKTRSNLTDLSEGINEEFQKLRSDLNSTNHSVNDIGIIVEQIRSNLTVETFPDIQTGRSDLNNMNRTLDSIEYFVQICKNLSMVVDKTKSDLYTLRVDLKNTNRSIGKLEDSVQETRVNITAFSELTNQELQALRGSHNHTNHTIGKLEDAVTAGGLILAMVSKQTDLNHEMIKAHLLNYLKFVDTVEKDFNEVNTAIARLALAGKLVAELLFSK